MLEKQAPAGFFGFLQEEVERLGGCPAAMCMVEHGARLYRELQQREEEEGRGHVPVTHVGIVGCGHTLQRKRAAAERAFGIDGGLVFGSDGLDMPGIVPTLLHDRSHFLQGPAEDAQHLRQLLTHARGQDEGKGGRALVAVTDDLRTTDPQWMQQRAAALQEALMDGDLVLLIQRQDRGPQACGLLNAEAVMAAGFELRRVATSQRVGGEGGVLYSVALLKRCDEPTGSGLELPQIPE